MQYKGIELTEMLPENWDGKSRKMLVWCNDTIYAKPEKRIVCGYDPIRLGWLVAETQAVCVWTHCAEIPEELKEEYSLNDEYGYGWTVFSILKE